MKNLAVTILITMLTITANPVFAGESEVKINPSLEEVSVFLDGKAGAYMTVASSVETGDGNPYIVYAEIRDINTNELVHYDFTIVNSPQANTLENHRFKFDPVVDGEFRVDMGLLSVDWNITYDWKNHVGTYEVRNNIAYDSFPNLTPEPDLDRVELLDLDYKTGKEITLATYINNNQSEDSFLVYVEIYNAKNDQFEDYVIVNNVSTENGEQKRIDINWTPKEQGYYYFSVAFFSSDWTEMFEWNHRVADFYVEFENFNESDRYYIYKDELEDGWYTGSWGSTHYFNESEWTWSGNSIRSEHRSTWGGITYFNDVGVDATKYDSLVFKTFVDEIGSNFRMNVEIFDVNGSRVGGTSIKSYIEDETGQIAGHWAEAVIPLSEINADNVTIGGVSFNIGNRVATTFMDELHFE